MKKSLSRLYFALKIVIKHMMYQPFKSLLMVIGFMGVFLVLILGLTLKDFLEVYYYDEVEQTYGDFDYKMQVSQYGDARFFSMTSFLNDDELVDMIDETVMFFEFDLYIEVQGNEDYVHVLSSDVESLKKITDAHVQTLDLQFDEILVTESMADHFGLSVGMPLDIQIDDVIQTMIVVEIIEDDRLFDGMMMFVDKVEAMPFFLQAISPDLVEFSSVFKNFYNRVYLDFNDHYETLEILMYIQSYDHYENLDFEQTIDHKAIDQFLNRNLSIFFMVMVIALVAITFVLKTTLDVYFETKRETFKTLHVLGDYKGFRYLISYIDMLLIMVVSYIGGALLSISLIGYGLDFFESDALYHIPFLSYIISGGVALILVVFVTFNYNQRLHQQDKNIVQKRLSVKYLSLSLIVILLGYMSVEILKNHILDSEIVVVLALLFVFGIVVILPKMGFWLFECLSKTGKLLTYQFKTLTRASVFKSFITLILIGFMTIMLLVYANYQLNERRDLYEKTYITDYVVAPMPYQYDRIGTELRNNVSIESYEAAGYFDYVEVEVESQSIRELISMDSDVIETYYDVEISYQAKQALKNVIKLVVVLPERYRELYDLDVGDAIDIYVNGQYGVQTFEIGGFFEKVLADLAFTNLHLIFDDAKNIYLIQGDETVGDELLDMYSSDMIKVIDVKSAMRAQLIEMERATTYVTVILTVLILSFFVAIINHMTLLFYEMTDVYAKEMVIGVSKKEMITSLIKIFGMISVVLMVATGSAFILLMRHLTDLSVLFGDYEKMDVVMKPLIQSFLYLGLLSILSYGVYIYRVIHLPIGKMMRVKNE